MSEKKIHTISIFTENHVGLLQRITILFTRRQINIESLNVSASEVKGIHRYTIVIKETEEHVKKVVKQIEKLVEVIKSFYHTDEETVYLEIALYKLPIDALANGFQIEQFVRENQAHVLTIEKDFFILEKTGHKAETQALLEKLEPFGLLEFVRSGRVAVNKSMKNVSEYLKELEQKHQEMDSK
ncbi:MAG: acetolactate synthase small subunit [Flammeovirgaceae bacterium]